MTSKFGFVCTNNSKIPIAKNKAYQKHRAWLKRDGNRRLRRQWVQAICNGDPYPLKFKPNTDYDIY